MVPPDIFDRIARRRTHRRAVGSASEDQWLTQRMEAELLDRLDVMTGQFASALIIGSADHSLRPALEARGLRVTTASPAGYPLIAIDEDRLPFADRSFDLIIAVGTLHTVNDVPGALIQIRRALRSDGLFLGAIVGAGSLPLLKSVLAQVEPGAARIHPQIDVRNAGDLLARAGFVAPVADSEDIRVRYPNLSRLFADLRANALTNTLIGRRPMTKRIISNATKIFAESDRTETIAIIHLTGWASPVR